MNSFTYNTYAQKLSAILGGFDWSKLDIAYDYLVDLIKSNRRLFICGNGGSAGNAMHIANDFIYGICPSGENAMNVEALSSNSSVLTCLGNDIGYDKVFSHQLKVKATTNDILLVLSGSGNSANIIEALKVAAEVGMTSIAILGFSGGEAKSKADVSIHFPVDDMQMSEDLQLIVGHMLMRKLNAEFKQ